MDLSQKIYVFSKQRQMLEENVSCFVKKTTQVETMVKEACLIFLIEKSKRLLVQLQEWEGRILGGWTGRQLTAEEVNKECLLLSKLQKLYHQYSSEYNEILQTLLCDKYQSML